MKRDFCLGSEWLYYKIYTGVKTADLVLLEKLYPVIFDLKEEKIIDKWFFIRYKDPSEHIRIRFNCKSPGAVSSVIAKIYPVLNKLLEKNIVWKVQTDTYQREIERYGENTMVDSESLFWHDSEMVLGYLALKSSFEKNEMQLIFSFTAIDSFLNSFSLTNTDKLFLMDELQTSFKCEFHADKVLKKEMDKHYRELWQDIDDFLTGKAQNQFPEIFKIIQHKKSKISAIVAAVQVEIQIPFLDFLRSHIHMIVNRQFTSRQRQYELIIYDHLYRYYKMIENRFNL
ncbi:thiopeptide-type bacteriocin biosynthesis protein [Flavobacterium sp. P4023]|uniref:Thiopeptide-type bacteriocin biosynthesis protein n=1 Tax=Flavobacterium flabelliforme TaxID=2816119 RepID=A0ABS5CV91_9FLAO|nr:thiopeptide-type bacteriocin biosynthesis protein [Flavobacterium flabelliforme]MBP4142543.1 thiopeptide-type bacteriocin biosynthesis protein [Flavobacterium flabelliforme]